MANANPIIFHKSSCITCKKVVSEIDRMKIDIKKRDFFKDPFSEKELKKIIKMSGLTPFDFLRRRDKMYKELNLEKTKHTDNEIILFMVKYPGLIKRPIVIKNKNFHIGKVEIKNLW
ncbi:MAG: arsenate reductase family protein [Nitrosopumilus sp.]|nr:arsenate reductase family protein [Nitrosopumilus sp.]MDH3385603.1 arsenate reductase family protein [Nitrosopumilus sp.]